MTREKVPDERRIGFRDDGDAGPPTTPDDAQAPGEQFRLVKKLGIGEHGKGLAARIVEVVARLAAGRVLQSFY